MVDHRQKTVAKDVEEPIEASVIIPRTRIPRYDAAKKAGRYDYEHD